MLFLYRHYVLTLSFLLAACGATSAQVTPTRIDKIVREHLGDHGTTTPGAAVLVTHRGETIFSKGYGMANLEYSFSITDTTVFDLASVAKQFTGYAIAKLVTEGKITLTDDVRKYVPEFPDFGPELTVEHLVHHTSGLRDWTSTLPLAGWSFKDVISLEQILRMVYKQRALNFPPGEEYAYSNAGYNVLAEIVQRVTGQEFQDWTAEHIFQPLGMERTRFWHDETNPIPGRAIGYFQNRGNYFPHPNLTTALGSSSLLSTTTDLAKWTNHLLDPGAERQDIVDLMFQNGRLNDGSSIDYAFGIEKDEYRDQPWINHDGGWAAFSTHVILVPEQALTIIILRNSWGNTYRMARAITDLYLPEQPSIEAATATEEAAHVSLSPKVLDAYVGTYKLGPGWYLTLSREGDRLQAQATNEDKFSVTTVREDFFRVPDYSNRSIEFEKDANGKVTSLVYLGESRPRLEGTSTFEPQRAPEYAGVYYCPELETFYEVKAEDGALSMHHFRKGRIDLFNAWNDEFGSGRGFLQTVEFSRNAQGEIDGLYVSNFRARRQWMEKQEQP
ncbi:MAG: serine hydrolase [Bacteroidota bacterium]